MSSTLAWGLQIAGWLTKRLRRFLLIGDGQENPAQKPPHTSDARGFDTIPWDTVLLVASIIAGTAVMLLAAWGVADGIRDHRRHAAQASKRLADLEARHDAVRDAYGEFETNLLDNLDRLALAYVTVPQTADFIDALDAARDAEREQAKHQEQAARERAQREERLAAWRAEREVLEERECARPCAVCGRARSGGLCGVCGNVRAAEVAVAEAVEIGLTARERLDATADQAEFTGRLESGLRDHVESIVGEAVARGATELTASVMRKLAAQEQLSRIRREALELFAVGPEAAAEAKAAFAAWMRRWHLHECDGQHDCRAFVREDAERVAHKARWRTAEHLLEQRLAAVSAQRSVPLGSGESDPCRVGAARVRAAISRPRAGLVA
ncbi:hypothetical protein GCM10020000_87020 [Streptomyces olivoverticillatus]